MGPLTLGLRLGLFQLSLGILGVLILGLLNRLLIQDIQVPAVLVAVAVGGQQLMGLLILVFVGIGTAIAAGGTAFSALVADRTTDAERPRVLSVVWGMRLLGVLLGSVLVNQVFGSACAADASRIAVLTAGPVPLDVPQRLALPQLL